MPELPEVETIRTGLDNALAGSTIQKIRLMRPDLRIPFPTDLAGRLASRRIEQVSRRAKYLLWQLDSQDVLIGHLGMSGAFIVHSKPKALAKHDHMELRLTDGRQVLYRDPRRFGLITMSTQDDLKTHKLIAHLGPEPLKNSFNADYLQSALARRNTPIKAALMDQKIVVGVGNIYASEALHLSGITPLKPALEAAKSAESLVKNIRKVLKDAIKSGGSSLQDFTDISGNTGYFQHNFLVYGRTNKPCIRCKTPIRNVIIAGRSSFFCPSCQS